MLHLRQEMVYSTYFLALEVGQTFLRRLKQRALNSAGVFFGDQRHEGTNILTALVMFLSGWQHKSLYFMFHVYRVDLGFG